MNHKNDMVGRILENIVDFGIFMLDRDGTILSWNPGAERIKGYAEEEIIGQHFSIFYGADDKADMVPARALETATREGRFAGEGWRLRKDGSRFWAAVVIERALDSHGALTGFVKVTRDISDRRELEIARERLLQAEKTEAVGKLTAGIAHDFNNFLTSAVNGVDIIKRLATDDRILRIAETIQIALGRGSKLVSQIMAFSKQHVLKPEITQVNDEIRVFEVLLQRVCGETIDIEFDLNGDIGLTKVDVAHFQSALMNLVMNARDAMPLGGALVVRTRRQHIERNHAQTLGIDPGSYVMVEVSDTGCGMSADTLSHAIEPFFTTKDVGKGSGLGLSQVSGFARQSNGQIEISSTEGHGTSVKLFLPFLEALPAARLPQAQIGHRREAILVVEDDPQVLEVAIELFKAEGFQVYAAEDALQALDILKRDIPIDVLFSDVIMPNGVNGVELARRARTVRPTIQVLLASGYAREALNQNHGLGFDAPFLQKPYRCGELLSAVDWLLGQPVPPAAPD